MDKMERIYVGGWFQRTTLHLSEIYDFLKEAHSPLDLNPDKLRNLQDSLAIKSVAMLPGDLDHILLENTADITVKIFEDGLVVLGKDNNSEIEDDIKALTDYYENRFSPAIAYIFSLGAPVPKELANIKTIYPYFAVLDRATGQDVDNLLDRFKQDKYFEVKNKKFEIYRGDKLYIVNNISEDLSNIENFIEEQVFMREFKTQLHRYLNLHRTVWERIAEVKEKGEIRGSEVGPFKSKVESYEKTINLIETRINQMGTYIKTRESIAENNKHLVDFLEVLDFKYETLTDTLDYIKQIWVMTKNYVNSALGLFSGIQAKSTESSVRNLTVVTSMGVGATLIGLFSQRLPEIHMSGVVYFLIVAVIGYTADKVMRTIYQRRMYKINDVEIAKDIK